MYKAILMAAVAATAVLAGCSKPAETTTTAAPAAPKVAYGSFGVDTAQMDTSVKPGDDFFKYVNGKWLASFKMPADKSSFGSFDKLVDNSENDVHSVLDGLAKTPQAPGSTPQKVADLYASWMDEAGIEKRGIEPLKPYLDRVAAVKTKADLMKLIGSVDFASPAAVTIDPDPGDPTKYAVWIGQAGLGMPNRDYYLKQGATFDKYRAAYLAYVTRIFELTGDPKPAASATQVIALEKKLAEVQWAPERQRNVKEAINPMDLPALQKLAPAIDWKAFLAGYGIEGVNRVIVGEKSALTDGMKLVDTQPLDAWKKYLAFHIASSNARDLPKAFDDARFDFYSKALQGVEQQRERWKRGVNLIDGEIGEGAGEIYVQKFFPPENKAKMDALVSNLLAALKVRIDKNEWMDDATRAEALKKLSTFEPRIGYPVKFRDYSKLTIEPGKLFENVVAGEHFDWNRKVSRLNDKVDRSEWDMVPQEVNAYYNPLMNQITFPAAILQPPFFDPAADPAVNYGAIGAIIGHEIGHGFDDQGKEFDETGKIRNWWTKDTDAKFKMSTTALGAQYDAYCPVADACVKGQLTMGENIGDLGGLQMAYTAYHLSLGDKPAPTIDGFTGDQRFFIAYAQAWQELLRDDWVRQQVMTDPHSPGQYRANGVVRNIDAWYDAFGVKEADKMYLPPDKRVHIW
jgi:endothelin-converting enzyme/putative endopeptidase